MISRASTSNQRSSFPYWDNTADNITIRMSSPAICRKRIDIRGVDLLVSVAANVVRT